MNLDDLERQIEQAPRRAVPAAWREEILAAARQAAAPAPQSQARPARQDGLLGRVFHTGAAGSGDAAYSDAGLAVVGRLPARGAPRPASLLARLSAMSSHLAAVLWPSPRAWAALAAVWLGILAAQFAVRDTPVPIAKAAPPLSEQVLFALAQQQRLLAALAEPWGATDLGAAKRAAAPEMREPKSPSRPPAPAPPGGENELEKREIPRPINRENGWLGPRRWPQAC